uniref:nitrogenase n=2 Tax=Unclassified Bacteria TaxID=49928 RepID=Q7BQA3_UNCXX|nr:vanadium dinitrogenase delta subunit [nitrogen-fixing bacterium SM1]AAD40077.1 vanadium dinitrogenase delta subunit [nitrogen-fixing bacterium SM2]
MSTRVEQLYQYIEERCLWQFFSRTWDREENIEGVLNQFGRLMTGEAPLKETPMDRLFYADALPIANDCRERFDWAATITKDDIAELIASIKGQLVENTITRSTNRELSHHLY